MLRLSALFLVAAAVCSTAKVFVLDDANFDQTLSENSPMLVEFYAPWCGHCKSLEPEYEEAGKILADKQAKVYLGKVDATSEAAAQLAKRFEVQGFPTLKFFPQGAKDGQVIDYDGERKAQNIVNWLEKKTGAPFTTLKTVADLNKAKSSVTEDNEKLVVVGVFSAKEQAMTFEDAAKKDFAREYYAVINDAALAKQVDASASAPFVKVLRSFNMSNPALTSDAAVIGNLDKLEKFIAQSSEPISIVQAYVDNDIESTIKSGIHLVEYYAPWCGYCKKFTAPYEKVADHFLNKETASKVVVAKYDGTSNDEITGKENIDSFPTLKMYKNGVAATYKGEFEADPVIKFVQEKLTAVAKTIASESDVAGFVDDVPTALVGCVSAKNDATMDTLAFQADSVMLKVGKLRCAEGKETLTVYQSGNKVASYPDINSLNDIAAVSKWVKRASINPVFKFDDAIFDEILAAEYKYIVFFFDNSVEGDEPEIKLFQKFAADQTFKDTAYSYASASEDYLLQFFGIKADALPAVRLLHTEGQMSSYVGPNEVTKEALAKMFKDFEQGDLEKVVQANGGGEGDAEDGKDYDEEEKGDEDDEGDEGDDEGEDEEEEEDDQDEL